jgi:hypothetical protein
MAGIRGAGLPLLFFFGDSPPLAAKISRFLMGNDPWWPLSCIGSEGLKEHGKGFGQLQN